jgi:hypothetical protein
MSTTAALAAAASANSAVAAAQASQAARTACISYTQNYNAQHATITEAREYAACVNRLYPDPPTGAETLALKAAIVVVFLAMIVGAWVGWHEDGPVGVFLGALLGACVGTALSLGVWGVVAGVRYLVS